MRHLSIVAALSAAVLVAAALLGTKVAGGADPYAYVTEAGLWQTGHLVVQEDVIRESPWPGAAGTFTPIGFREAGRRRDAITPIYAPGLPLLMAAFQVVFGYCAAFAVVPLAAAAIVWLTFTLGNQVFGRRDLALWGAMLVATSPTFLHQAMIPISDVPVTAAWLAAVIVAFAGWPFAAGLIGAVAVCIRPNLVPVAIPLLAWTMLRDLDDRRTRGRLGTWTVRVAAGLVPSAIGIAWLNTHLYGSPFESGYGSLEDLYSWRYLWKNVAQFASWTAGTDTPVVALAGIFFVAPRLLPPSRIVHPRIILGGVVAVVVLSYVFYIPFDSSWFLRFLLPAWPIVMLLTAAALDGLASKVSDTPRSATLRKFGVAAVVIMLALHGVATTARRGSFTMWRSESRYVDVARFIGAATDPQAVIISWQHTGSIRFYGDRVTLHFNRLDRRWLDRAVARLSSIGRRPYFVLDDQEVEAFRARFAPDNRLGALDWPPMALLEDPRVLVFDPANRTSNVKPSLIRSSGGRSGRRCEPPAVWPPRTQIQ